MDGEMFTHSEEIKKFGVGADVTAVITRQAEIWVTYFSEPDNLKAPYERIE